MCTSANLICRCNFPICECKCCYIKSTFNIINSFRVCRLVDYIRASCDFKCEIICICLVVAKFVCISSNYVLTGIYHFIKLLCAVFVVIFNCRSLNTFRSCYCNFPSCSVIYFGCGRNAEHFLCYNSRCNFESTNYKFFFYCIIVFSSIDCCVNCVFTNINSCYFIIERKNNIGLFNACECCIYCNIISAGYECGFIVYTAE